MIINYKYDANKIIDSANVKNMNEARKYAIDNLKWSKSPKGPHSYGVWKGDEPIGVIAYDQAIKRFDWLNFRDGYKKSTIVDARSGALTSFKIIQDPASKVVVYDTKTRKPAVIDGKLMVRKMVKYKVIKNDDLRQSFEAELPEGYYPRYTNSEECFNFRLSWADSAKVYRMDNGKLAAKKGWDRSGNGILIWSKG